MMNEKAKQLFGDENMTDLEYDLRLNLEVVWHGYDEIRVNYASSADNLSVEGYQKIIWHNVRKELPECDKYVLGHCPSEYNPFAVVKCVKDRWDYAYWYDDNENCYIVDYWTELPKFSE